MVVVAKNQMVVQGKWLVIPGISADLNLNPTVGLFGRFTIGILIHTIRFNLNANKLKGMRSKMPSHKINYYPLKIRIISILFVLFVLLIYNFMFLWYPDKLVLSYCLFQILLTATCLLLVRIYVIHSHINKLYSIIETQGKFNDFADREHADKS